MLLFQVINIICQGRPTRVTDQQAHNQAKINDTINTTDFDMIEMVRKNEELIRLLTHNLSSFTIIVHLERIFSISF